MADYIRPTPRNPLLGLIADAMMGGLAYMEDPRRTQQLQGLGGLLSDTGIAQTVDRLASGEPLTKGSGFATRMKPETAAAAMTLGPEAVPIGRAAMGALRATKGLPVGMGIKSVGTIDELTGLPLNPDGTVTLFHHTNKNAAEQIAKTGRLKSAGEPSVYLTTQKTPDTGYGDVVVPVRVRPSMLNLDDEFPGGRMDFRIDVGRPKGSIPVVVEKPSFEYPQEEALRLAQQRAALPVSEGGLGLPPNNTPMDRARAMGFTTPAYRGTTANEVTGKARTFASENPDVANQYAGYLSQFSDDPQMLDAMMKLTPNGNVMPLLVKDAAKARARTNVPDYEMILDANQARSRFAAFDPTRRNEPDLLAGALPFTALLDEENRALLEQQFGGLLGR